MSEPTKPKRKRRWFQFSLASLFLLVTVAVGVLVAWRAYVEPYHRQRSTMALIERLGGEYQTTAGPSWLSPLLGYDAQDVVSVRLADCDDPNDYLDAVSRLPNLEALAVGGPNFSDEHLQALHRVKPLRQLTIDSTSVTDDAVTALNEGRPDLAVQRSEYRAARAITRTFSVDGLVYRPAMVHITWLEYIKPHLPAFDPSAEVPFAYLPTLTLLQGVDLASARLDETALAHIGRAKSLRTLILSKTATGDAGLAQLSQLTNLRKLFLAETQVSDAGLTHLHNMPTLEVLDLSNTRVTAAGAEKLRRALPKCKVLWSK